MAKKSDLGSPYGELAFILEPVNNSGLLVKALWHT